MIKDNYLIPLTMIIGIGILFFFPSPESNFLAYIVTALFFVILIIALVVWNKGGKS